MSDRIGDPLSSSEGTTAPNSSSETADSGHSSQSKHAPAAQFTIFAIPKPFVGQARQIQLNAIGSWRRLAPQAEILLLGDEEGIAEVACEWGLKHVAHLRRNSQGTPLLDSAFEIAANNATTPFLVYCNCDVMFLENLAHAMRRLAEVAPPEFIAFGRRTELAVESLINFEDSKEVESLRASISKRGCWDSIVCKEYFIFRRGTFAMIPAFAVGRGNWDNWMIRSSKDRSVPVIDMSNYITAVHQNHEYCHTRRSRWNNYVSGDEAKQNERLAGGKNIISGSTPDWKLDQAGLRPIALSGLQLAFWKDLPRFIWFTKKLVVG